MHLSKLQQAEFGYLYYSLYSYRRKIESDIRNIIENNAKKAHIASGENSATLFELTQKLRKISDITSRVISLNKGYRK